MGGFHSNGIFGLESDIVNKGIYPYTNATACTRRHAYRQFRSANTFKSVCVKTDEIHVINDISEVHKFAMNQVNKSRHKYSYKIWYSKKTI